MIATFWRTRIYPHRLSLSLIACTVLLAAMAIRMVDQPLIADEVDFVRDGTNPNWAQDRAQVPHPPGDVYLIRLCYSALGAHDWVARLPGIASGLVTLLLITYVVRAAYGDAEKGKDIASIAVWLFALNPLSVQNMILLDIDNTVLTAVMLGAIWAWYRLQASPAWQRVTILSVIFSVSLWFKLTTPPMLIVIMAIAHLLRRQFRRCAEMAIVGGLALTVFVATFALLVELTGFSPENVLSSARRIPSVAQMVVNLPQSLGIFLLWLAPLQVILWGTGLWNFIRSTIRRERRNDDLLHLYAAGVTLAYAALAFAPWYYPKYHAPVVPVIAILVAAGLTNSLTILNNSRSPIRKWITLTAVLTGIVQLALVGDPLRRVYDALYFSANPDLNQRLGQGAVASMGLCWLVPVTIAVGTSMAVRFKTSVRDTLTALFGATMVSVMLVTTWVQVTANYSTRYLYGQGYDGLRQTVALVQNRIADADTIIAPKSIWYYAHTNGQYIEGFMCPSCTAARFLDTIKDAEPAAIVWAIQNANSSQVAHDARVRAFLQECYLKEVRGDFTIYLRDPTEACPK